MTVRNAVYAALMPALLLVGCSAPPRQVHHLHNEVSKLNKELSQLTRQASALELQNSLNLHAGQGAWLVPEASTPVVLQSQIADLSLLLVSVQADNDNSRILLRVHTSASAALPAFSARVEWGERDSVSGKPLPGSGHIQQIHVDAGLTSSRDVTLAVLLEDIQPQQLGYVRVHDIVADKTQ
ncbi:hypothetical protein BL250_04625 [Erwinia sp. OLTSP20]|uniref:DUF3251 domain-containing protein n=1 Tax=unclassified Erwinia TaxID=2622719 RepID=UPI000C17896E|nr:MULTISPECIES: DUF3251 domain-containing protein [unclassified Erwinia]PIJ52252.1 hypothetical protein BV501_00600 [Erwinia sp. OAMSP11]PIJ75705.1 hypothetical protein BK416_00920 [Erwinia sp. OLSSP12]PIJ83666.1 hypothetical protein BLD46_09390 [Erwinia sp. OLMTSP26]PIJ84259.1 hypothetical protein BLD47_02645 [Erwinia sp. OLCASP19]PIJ88724.1 hypothetical protein BLD49_00955 [Erwinia sp. OLMDSP33]